MSLTVQQLKDFLNSQPATNEHGEPNEVWVGGTDGLSNAAQSVECLNAGDICLELNVPFQTLTPSDKRVLHSISKIVHMVAIKELSTRPLPDRIDAVSLYCMLQSIMLKLRDI